MISPDRPTKLSPHSTHEVLDYEGFLFPCLIPNSMEIWEVSLIPQKHGDEDDGGSWPPESHAASHFEVPPPRRRNPQRERGVRRSPKKVIK